MPEDGRLSGEQVKGHLATLVLSIVGERPRHGYEIMKTLAERSEGALEFGQGTVYPLLYGLEEQRLVASEDRTIEGRRRRVYRLTSAGRKSLGERRKEWERFQIAINQILNPKKTGGIGHVAV